MSFVDKSQLEPGCAVLLHNKGLSIVGVLADDVDPMVGRCRLKPVLASTEQDVLRLGSLTQCPCVQLSNLSTCHSMEGAWSQRLKAKCDEALSSVAFNFSLRRYTMVSVMKVDKAPLESYADVGGLEDQIQEIKEAVELPLTHPELYEDIGRGSSRPLFSSTYALFVGYVGYLQ